MASFPPENQWPLNTFQYTDGHWTDLDWMPSQAQSNTTLNEYREISTQLDFKAVSASMIITLLYHRPWKNNNNLLNMLNTYLGRVTLFFYFLLCSSEKAEAVKLTLTYKQRNSDRRRRENLSCFALKWSRNFGGDWRKKIFLGLGRWAVVLCASLITGKIAGHLVALICHKLADEMSFLSGSRRRWLSFLVWRASWWRLSNKPWGTSSSRFVQVLKVSVVPLCRGWQTSPFASNRINSVQTASRRNLRRNSADTNEVNKKFSYESTSPRWAVSVNHQASSELTTHIWDSSFKTQTLQKICGEKV